MGPRSQCERRWVFYLRKSRHCPKFGCVFFPQPLSARASTSLERFFSTFPKKKKTTLLPLWLEARLAARGSLCTCMCNPVTLSHPEHLRLFPPSHPYSVFPVVFLGIHVQGHVPVRMPPEPLDIGDWRRVSRRKKNNLTQGHLHSKPKRPNHAVQTRCRYNIQYASCKPSRHVNVQLSKGLGRVSKRPRDTKSEEVVTRCRQGKNGLETSFLSASPPHKDISALLF